jgi:molybdopterin converting factor small subunit
MNVDVKLFARARDLVGSDRVRIELPPAARVADLRTALAEGFPRLRPLVPNLFVAIGTDYVDDTVAIQPADEIACFPPVSGG